jgi:hypothetical protein
MMEMMEMMEFNGFIYGSLQVVRHNGKPGTTFQQRWVGCQQSTFHIQVREMLPEKEAAPLSAKRLVEALSGLAAPWRR